MLETWDKLELPAAAFPRAAIRRADLRAILRLLSTGDTCCSLVGPSNLGKSILLRSLLLPEVQQLLAEPHAATPPPQVVGVFVDCLALGDEADGRAFYELIAQHIGHALQANGILLDAWADPDSVRTEVYGLPALPAVRSWFDSHLRRLMRQCPLTLLLILDEFDQSLRTLHAESLNLLVTLKDEYGARLRYVVSTSQSLRALRDNLSIYEFRELFHMSQHVLRPLARADAEELIRYLEAALRIPHNDHLTAMLLELAGGHPGLLRRLYQLLNHDPASFADQEVATLLPKLIRATPIRKECLRLWGELEPEEQEELLQFVDDHGGMHTPQLYPAATAKGLLRWQGDRYALFCPLLREFVVAELTRNTEVTQRGLYCNADQDRIWLDGREITDQVRSSHQRRFLLELYAAQGRICTYEDIAEALHGNSDGVTERSLRAIAKRLKTAVPGLDKYIAVVDGEGFRLVNPAD